MFLVTIYLIHEIFSSIKWGKIEDGRVIVAVMGVTGSGKSSFIRKMTGREDIVVGDSLSSGEFRRAR